jgi:hypothetical protein
MDTGGGGGMCVEVEELYETEQQWRPTNATGSHLHARLLFWLVTQGWIFVFVNEVDSLVQVSKSSSVMARSLHNGMLHIYVRGGS